MPGALLYFMFVLCLFFMWGVHLPQHRGGQRSALLSCSQGDRACVSVLLSGSLHWWDPEIDLRSSELAMSIFAP